MSSSIDFGLISYNTHLFFPDKIIPDFGPLFADSDRKIAIDQKYLELVSPYSKSGVIRIAALQEVWYSSFANDITKDVAHHGSYKNEFVNNRSILPPSLNPSGLILLADPACSFHDQTYFDYIANCEVDGWDLQDVFTGKGFLQVKCDFDIEGQPKVALGLFTTHMPTNYGEHHGSVSGCFQALADAVTAFRNKYKNYAVIVLGDLNVDNGSAEYTALVTNILLTNTGLQNASSAIDPGYSINPQTNTLWQEFNQNNTDRSSKLIDYFFFADSLDGTSQKVTLNSFSVQTEGLTVTEKGLPYNCSDHFPIEAQITIETP